MTTTIYLNLYDQYDNCKTKGFDVETEWLVNVFGLDGMSLQEYLDEYTCEEAMDIYTVALLDDAIVREWYC